MLIKYDPEVNPLGSVIEVADRKIAIATAVNDINQSFEAFWKGERHFARWTEGDISGTRRSFINSRFEHYLSPLAGVEILRLYNCFLILLDSKVVLHIKKDDGELSCNPPPKILQRLDLVLRRSRKPTMLPFPGWEDYVKSEPSVKDLTAEVDLRLRDVKVIVGLYRPTIDYSIVNFTIGIQSGKTLIHPYEINLSTPSLTARSVVKRNRTTTTTFSSETKDIAIDSNE